MKRLKSESHGGSMGSRMADSKQSRAVPFKNERTKLTLSVSSSNRSLQSRKLSLHCRMKVRSFRELEPSNGSSSRSLGLELLFVLETFPIASVNTVPSASCELETGVSSSVGSRCADPRCVDMLAGVGGYVDCRVMGFEFPELSSSTVPALIELWVVS